MKLLDHYYDELCELIYHIPSDRDGWTHFAQRLIQIFDASYVHIQAIDFSHNVLSYSNGIGPLPLEIYAEAELNYLHYPTEADPRWGKFLDPERKGWYQCHHHVTEEFVQKSDLYQKILLPSRLRYVATHELIWDEKLCVFWSVTTSPQRQPLNAQELAFLDRLMPHLKRVVLAQRHLYEFSLNNIIGYNLIDQIPQPIILINLAGQVVHYNQKVPPLLTTQSLLQMKQHRLILPAVDYDRFLNLLYEIEAAFRYQQEKLEHFKNTKFLISNTTQSLELTINLLVSEKEMSFFGIRPLVMLTVNEGGDHNVPLDKKTIYHVYHDILKRDYKLTKRELQLCDLFITGMNLEQIADAMSLTRSSVRTYLKYIFTKTQCKSQVELMQFLMSKSHLGID